MTAEQIIEEIKRLDAKDQLGVIRFAYQLDVERKLSGEELSSLAARMTENRRSCGGSDDSRKHCSRLLRSAAPNQRLGGVGKFKSGGRSRVIFA